MEILSPAGNPEALERAIAAGADAVYLGASVFSARAGAGNFNPEELEKAVALAHLHHVRVYVTVNTLVKDEELSGVRELLRVLRDLRVDGVLVQDLGVLDLIRKEFPDLRVHASTQMAIHNATGAKWCRELGMKRVVLARECSMDEIRKCAETGIEIEVFGHGAQCVSVSGECLFSSMAGERSGNRGRCAQPCRKKYEYDGKWGAWLSPRDVCVRDHLPELEAAGAASLKIEGRLKRPEYVYVVTDAYKRAEKNFMPANGAETDALKQIFNRGGFMTGYAFGTEDAGVIQPESVNHQGLSLGRVESVKGRMAYVRLERNLLNGDGIRFEPAGEMTYAGKDVSAGETAVVRLRDGLNVKTGDRVRRMWDTKQLQDAMAAGMPEISVDLDLRAVPGDALRLILTDGEASAEVTGEIVEAARARETTAEEMEKQLRKTGGTDFTVENVRVETSGAFVPVSMLNALRREGLEQFARARRGEFEFAGNGEAAPEARADKAGAESTLLSGEIMVTVRDEAQAAAIRRENRNLIRFPEDFRPEAMEKLAAEMKAGDWLRLPEVCEEATLALLYDWVARNREKLGGVVIGSVGQLGNDWPVRIAAGPGVPVMNARAAAFLKAQGCAWVTASPELTKEETESLIEQAPLPVVVTVYGRTQLMILHHCPARTAQGWENGHAKCRMCDSEDPRALRGHALRDEMGHSFPLLRERLPEGCLVRVMNAVPTDLCGARGISYRAAEVSTESAEETAVIMDCLEKYEKAPGEHTRGHWNRKVL